MRDGRPSTTAAGVAAARGVAGIDPLAASLLEGPLAWILRAGQVGPRMAAVVNVAMLGLVDHVEMRTRAIDAAVLEAVAAGVRQMVILGAGLDARAWRMPELRDVVVFEVDHPSTQAFKKPRIETRVPMAREVRFVAVDFEGDVLGEKLAAVGQDATRSTFWLWEGVTPYLPIEATRATLDAVAARSADGSLVGVTYATPRATTLRPRVAHIAKKGFRLLGEPVRGLIASDAMEAELARVGFRLIADTSALDWAARFGGNRRRRMRVDEHLAVAVKGSG